MIRKSHFSDDGKYRYQLIRIWDENRPYAMCIGLNPSVAGSKKKDGTEKDDPTIIRLIGTLKALGYGGFYMVNLYSFIASKPTDLFAAAEPIGENHSWALYDAKIRTMHTIFCWGSFKGIESRVKEMLELYPDAYCFGRTANGSPWHPRAMSYIKDFTYDKATLTKFIK